MIVHSSSRRGLTPFALSAFALSAFALAAFAALSAIAPAGAQTPPRAKELGTALNSAVYIGNSFFYYNDSLHGHVGRMVAEGVRGHRFRSTSVTIGGSGFDWHDVASYFRPNGIGTYSFDANNNVVFNDPKQKLFDIAIMMDCSQCPIHPTLGAVFTEYARRHSETVRSHGALPVFFMSWAYADKPEMTVELAEAYTKAANDNGALVIPAGLAYTAGLDAAVAHHLQKVAWETVEAYFR